jgi:tetratricopeptide (TPR) repeat protein
VLLPKLRKVTSFFSSCNIDYRYQEALSDFDKALELESENSVIYSNRGLVNRKLERYEAAIVDYTNELSYSSYQNLKALNNRAYCFAKLTRY